MFTFACVNSITNQFLGYVEADTEDNAYTVAMIKFDVDSQDIEVYCQ